MIFVNTAGAQPPAMKPNRAKQKRSRTILIIVTVLLAVGVLVRFQYRRDLRVAEARASSGSKLISTSCGMIEYADVGTGAPVLVIHGAGGGFDQGVEVARPLIGRGFRVIAPSRFGYLRTPLPADASPMAQADAHACLLDALRLDKVSVIGVSAGAPSAMQLCLRHSDRCTALVLGVPLVYSPQPAGASPERRSAVRKFLLNTTLSSDFSFWIMSKLAHSAMTEAVLGTPQKDVENASADERARVAAFLSQIEPVSRRKKGLLNEARIAQSLPRYDLERVNVPTLVFSVEDDLYKTYPGARYTAEHIHGARFLSYPTGGHLNVGHQEEIWSEAQKFLVEVDRSQE
jgi:pimeloyl-ACP methyl ester carboxylesterase